MSLFASEKAEKTEVSVLFLSTTTTPQELAPVVGLLLYPVEIGAKSRDAKQILPNSFAEWKSQMSLGMYVKFH